LGQRTRGKILETPVAGIAPEGYRGRGT